MRAKLVKHGSPSNAGGSLASAALHAYAQAYQEFQESQAKKFKKDQAPPWSICHVTQKMPIYKGFFGSHHVKISLCTKP